MCCWHEISSNEMMSVTVIYTMQKKQKQKKTQPSNPNLYMVKTKNPQPTGLIPSYFK